MPTQSAQGYRGQCFFSHLVVSSLTGLKVLSWFLRDNSPELVPLQKRQNLWKKRAAERACVRGDVENK